MVAQTSIAIHPSHRKAVRAATQAGENVVMSHKAIAVAALIAVFNFAAGAQPTTPTVTIDSGKLAGNEKDGMMSFLGIPYASPPTGDLDSSAQRAFGQSSDPTARRLRQRGSVSNVRILEVVRNTLRGPFSVYAKSPMHSSSHQGVLGQ